MEEQAKEIKENKKINSVHMKLLQIRKELKSIGKTKNGTEKYATVKSSDVMTTIKEAINKYSLIFVPHLVGKEMKKVAGSYEDMRAETTHNPYKNKWDTSCVYTVIKFNLDYQIIDAETSDEISVSWFAISEDSTDSSKAYGKALTYAEKYFFLKLFQIPTDDDDIDSYKSGVNHQDNKQLDDKKNKPKENIELNADQKAKLQELRSMIWELNNKDAEKGKAYLFAKTQFENKQGNMVGGRKSSNELSGKQIDILYPKVKTDFEDMMRAKIPTTQEENLVEFPDPK